MDAGAVPRITTSPGGQPAITASRDRPAAPPVQAGRPLEPARQVAGARIQYMRVRVCCACMGVCFCRLRMAQSTLACSSRIVPNMNCITKKQPWPPAAQGALRQRLRSNTTPAPPHAAQSVAQRLQVKQACIYACRCACRKSQNLKPRQ